ncbi:hypothetical protein D3C80_1638270 [compost metagenome]
MLPANTAEGYTMNATCSNSQVYWFKESQTYTIEGKYVYDHYGIGWHCVESKLTAGFYTIYSRLGRSIATMTATK